MSAMKELEGVEGFAKFTTAISGEYPNLTKGLLGVKSSLTGMGAAMSQATGIGAKLKAGLGSLGGAAKSLWGIIAAHPILATVAACAALVAILKSIEAAQEEAEEQIVSTARKRAEESKKAAQQSQEDLESLDNLIAKYKALKSVSVLDTNSRNEIRDIQDKITDLVGDEASKLDLVNGKLLTQKEILDGIYSNQEKDTEKKYQKALDDAYDYVDKVKRKASNARVIYTSNGDSWYKSITNGSYYKGGDIDTTQSLGGVTLGFQNNQLEDAEIIQTIRKKAEEYGLYFANEIWGSQDAWFAWDKDISTTKLKEAIDAIIKTWEEELGDDANGSELLSSLKSFRDSLDSETNSVKEALENLVNIHISRENYNNEDVNSYKDYIELREKIAQEIKASNPTIEEAIDDGSITEGQLNNFIDKSLSDYEKFANFSNLEKRMGENHEIKYPIYVKLSPMPVNPENSDYVEWEENVNKLLSQYSDRVQDFAYAFVMNGSISDESELKEQLREIETWLDSLTDTEKKYLNKINENNTDAINWGLEEWKEAVENFEIPQEDKITFSKLLDDTEFTTAYENYKTNIQKLADVRKKILDGSITETEKQELFNLYPELASRTSDLADGVDELSEKFKTDALEYFENQLKYMLTDEDKEALEAYTQSLMDLDSEAQQVKDTISRLTTQIDNLQSVFDTAKGVIDDYNDNGYLTLDNLQSILSMEPEYINLLIDESGQINLNNQAYKDYIISKAKSLLFNQLQNLYNTILGMSAEEAQAYATSKAVDEETRSVKDLLTATTELYIVQAQQKDAANGGTAYMDALTRSFKTAANYASIVESYINSLSTSENEFSTATDETTSALESQKEALEDEKDALEEQKEALEDAKDALEDYKDELEEAQGNINSLLDIIQDYIKQTKEDEKDALQESIDALEDKKDALDEEKDAYADIIDKKKEALRLEKEEKENAEELAEKQNSAAKAALALAVANLDDSQAGKKAQKLAQDDYTSANNDLQSYLRDQTYNKRVAALEKDQEEFEEAIEKRKAVIDQHIADIEKKIDEIDEYLDNPRAIYEDACAMMDNYGDDLYNKLWGYVYRYTTKTKTEFTDTYQKGVDSLGKFKSSNEITKDVMEKLQGKIYDTDRQISLLNTQIGIYEGHIDTLDGKIDGLSTAINNTSTPISNAATSISGLGDSVSYYADALERLKNASNSNNQNNTKTTQKSKYWIQYGRHYLETDYEYENTTEGLKAAALELARKYGIATGSGYAPKSVIAEFENILLKNLPSGKNGTYVSHYATGTYSSKGKLAVTQEDALEAIFGKLSNGQYTLMNPGSQVFDGDATTNLHKFMDNPADFINRFSSYGSYLSSRYGSADAAIKSLTSTVHNDNSMGDISLSMPVYIQGDATQSTVNALNKERKNLKDEILREIVRLGERNRRIQ